MSNTDPRPTSSEGAHTVYGRRPPVGRRRRWIWVVLGLLASAIVLFFIYQATTPPATAGYGGGGGRSGRRGGAGAGGPPTSVNAALAARGDMPIYLDELGTVTPTATVTVIPQISGVIESVAFKEGQFVKKGEILAQIDPRPYQAALLQAQGTLAKDQGALNIARVDLKRYQALKAQNSIATQQVDDQAAIVVQDEGQVKADAAAVETQKLNLIYSRVTSPVDGRVGLRQVDPGNYFTAGTSTGIVVVTVLQPMDVLFTLPEDSLDAVARRIKSGATLGAVAYDRSQSTQLAKGALLTLDNQVDTTTGTVRAKARFANADLGLFPNQFVNIRLTVDTLKNAVIVPTSAILKGPDGMFVYTVSRSRTAKVTNVKVGPAAGENTAILSGLSGGEVVITDGSDRLKDGSRVLLPGDCIPARGGAGARPYGAGPPAGGAPSGGFLGLFGKKPAADPLAAMRCRPGEKPHSLLAAQTVPTVNPASEAAPPSPAGQGPASGPTAPGARAAAHAAPAGAPAQAPETAPAEGGGESGGGGRMRAMLAGLNLDAQQQEKAKAIFAAAREEAESSGDMRGAFQNAFAKLDAILRPDQKAKLAQMRAEMAARRASGGGGPSDQ